MIIEKAGLLNFDYFWIKMLLNLPSSFDLLQLFDEFGARIMKCYF